MNPKCKTRPDLPSAVHFLADVLVFYARWGHYAEQLMEAIQEWAKSASVKKRIGVMFLDQGLSIERLTEEQMAEGGWVRAPGGEHDDVNMRSSGSEVAP